MAEYVKWDISVPLTEGVTNGVLATFTLISGYFLGAKKISGIKDAMAFYKKRFLRFYPLFFISSTAFLFIYLIWDIQYIGSVQQYLLTLLGLSCIITPAPQTIWFISMLILFYALTPVINSAKGCLKKFLYCVTIFAVFQLLDLFLFDVDNRLLLFFPFYCIGLLIANKVKFTDKINYIYAIFLFILFIVISLFEKLNSLYLVKVLMVCAFILFAFELGKMCNKISFCKKTLERISYASMCAYLFHRQMFGLVYKLIGVFPVWAAYLIILPLLMVVSYCVQYTYDKIVISFEE